MDTMDLVRALVSELAIKDKRTSLEKDILDTWNELYKQPFDEKSAKKQVDSNDITHPDIDSAIADNDKSGITKAVNWQGGGGYRFFELAPSLINRDPFGEYVINEEYDADMLAAAVALHEGFNYQPDGNLFWKQSVGNESSYLFVTTRHLTGTFLDSIKDTMEDGEYLVIACRSFDSGLDKAYSNITIKKIPQMLLERCEFDKADYNLNIVHPPVYDDEMDEEDCDE